MTQGEIRKYIKQYKLLTGATRMEEYLNQARHCANKATKICDQLQNSIAAFLEEEKNAD